MDDTFANGGSLSSSSVQDSPRDLSTCSGGFLPPSSPLHTSSSKDLLSESRRRELSPHLSRSSAPASPHRGLPSSTSAANTTVTSSSSSRTSSPSRPARFVFFLVVVSPYRVRCDLKGLFCYIILRKPWKILGLFMHPRPLGRHIGIDG